MSFNFKTTSLWLVSLLVTVSCNSRELEFSEKVKQEQEFTMSIDQAQETMVTAWVLMVTLVMTETSGHGRRTVI